MSLNQHSASEDTANGHKRRGPDRLMPIVVRIPESQVWELERIAVDQKTKRHPMLVALIGSHIAAHPPKSGPASERGAA